MPPSTTSRKKRILIVDDRQDHSGAVGQLLNEDFELVGRLSDGASALHETARLEPDVVLLDISLEDMDGVEVARQLIAQNSEAKIIFLSVHERPSLVGLAAELGASGYVYKSRAAAELRRAIARVCIGDKYFPLV